MYSLDNHSLDSFLLYRLEALHATRSKVAAENVRDGVLQQLSALQESTNRKDRELSECHTRIDALSQTLAGAQREVKSCASIFCMCACQRIFPSPFPPFSPKIPFLQSLYLCASPLGPPSNLFFYACLRLPAQAFCVRVMEVHAAREIQYVSSFRDVWTLRSLSCALSAGSLQVHCTIVIMPLLCF